MKKLMAFVGSLLVMSPAFAQNSNAKDKNKTQGVSKVKQQDVQKEPAAQQKAAGSYVKNAGQVKMTKTAPQQKLSGQKAPLKNSAGGK